MRTGSVVLSFMIALALCRSIAASQAQSSDRQLRTMATEQMIDSEDDAALLEYAEAHLAPSYRESFESDEALLEYLRELRGRVAPIGGVGLMLTDSGGIELHISNRKLKSVVALRLEDEAPYRITELTLAKSEAKGAGPSIDWSNMEEKLEEGAAKGFSGSVLAVRDGEVVLERGFGHADPKAEHPVTPETLFAIGSTPIDFTHGAILKLDEMGKLSLSDPIGKYFDDVPEDKQAITLEHLRTSQSGLIDFPGIVEVDANLDLSWIDRAEFLRRVLAAPLSFEPGSGEQHSHCAWGVLAAVVEIASGQGYEEFLRENFFMPAGMDRTGNYPLAQRFPASEVAVGLGGNEWGEINSPAHWGETSWLVLGSGGMVSTPGDLYRWRMFLRGGEALGADAQRKYGVDGVFMAEGGNDRGFINTIGAAGDDLVIVCSNSHVAMDDFSAQLATAVASIGTGE
jgi:CubicO group peptidase (beta-lactamase class C family)